VTVEGRKKQMSLRESRSGCALMVKQMIGRKTLLMVVLAAALSPSAVAQINCTSGGATTKLSCLIPTTVTPPNYTFSNGSTGAVSGNFGSFLQADLGGEISQIPLASPASGIIFTTDPTLHVPVPSDQSLGPILTQRAETIGRHKVYMAVTYQYFLLQDADGHGLKSLPAVFLLSSNNTPSNPDTVAIANSRIDLKVHQWVGYVTYGITNRIDVSAAVPLLRVDMRYTVNEQLFKSDGTVVPVCGAGVTPPCVPSNPFPKSNAQESTGIGDVVLAAKATLWKMKHGGLALGGEFRLPSGDAQNFLGSGTIGVKPFMAFTYSGRVSPHLNVGYQANGKTELVVTGAGKKGRLPNRLIYSAGADWRLTRRITVAADVLAQRVIQAPEAKITTLTPFPTSNPNFSIFPTTISSSGTYNRTDGSIGFKLKPLGKMLLTGNLLVKLDQGGLRSRMAPLFGASYTF
jgi:hypothetical protein